ncbi:DNA repair protein RecO [bacterium BMS3Abin03]|nr:DNA repair protein RecO [bacterium BMS3Abin03]
MSEIVKAEAIVLTKINYSDTSNIASLYTDEFGKISVIIKGGRNPKSKFGMIVDPLNYINIIIYKKETREVQLLSGADLISHFPNIKEDLNSMKYAYAIIELVKNLTPESEPHKLIFKGLTRILSLLDQSREKPEILFGRFILFFLKEIGYEIQLNKCSICNKTGLKNKSLGYNYERGLLCDDCRKENITNYSIEPELFNYLFCLKNNEQISSLTEKITKAANNFFEAYIQFHVTNFKGIQSLRSFN